MAGSALAERPIAVPAVTTDQLELVRKTVAKDASPDELKLYLYDCARQGVHPLDKLIHFTKRNGKYTPVTSIDFMRTRAADTGEYAGSDDAVFRPELVTSVGHPDVATVTVYRLVQGQRCSFTATARWSEYKPDQNDFMWKKMPHTMLAKCAEGCALRKGFPRQLSGLYTREEMDQAGPVAGEVTIQIGAADPPAEVVDVTTGATVPASERPTPPDGYRYIDGYRIENGWHHVTLNGAAGNGGGLTYKTKLESIGNVAAHAFQNGLPVRVEAKPGRSKDEFWLNKITTYKPEPSAPVSREPGDEAF